MFDGLIPLLEYIEYFSRIDVKRTKNEILARVMEDRELKSMIAQIETWKKPFEADKKILGRMAM